MVIPAGDLAGPFHWGATDVSVFGFFFFSWADQISQRRLSSLLSEYIPPGC